MAGNISVKLDTHVLDMLDKQAPGRAHKACGKIANDYVAYVLSHWSPVSPSAEGEAPAVVTGNLANSIQAKPIRDRLWWVIAATEYAAMLEYGTLHMAARPFMLPAAEAIRDLLPEAFKAVVEVK